MRLAIALLSLGCVLAARAEAQCDRSPRIVWSYPEPGAQDVAYGAPLLIRTTADIAQVRLTTSEHEDSAVTPAMPAIFGDVILEPAVFGLFLRAGGPVSVELVTVGGETLELELEASATTVTEPAPPNVTTRIAGHFIGAGLERLSLRCRSILTSATRGECVDPALQRLVGLDVRIEDADTGLAAELGVRAWRIMAAGDQLPIMAPRLWPADCGPPAFLMLDDSDDPSVCVNLIAFGDAPTASLGFQQYCLGQGQPWPEVEAQDAGVAEPDASTALPDAGVIWEPPMMMPCGPCGCFVVGCDLIDPDGTGGSISSGGTGGGAAGASAGQGGSGAAAAAEGAASNRSSGCGCALVHRERSALTWAVWPLIAIALRARRRRARNTHA